MNISIILYVCLAVFLFLASPTLADSVKVIDDAIWQNKKADPNADTVEGASGTKRAKGKESRLTTDKEEEIRDKCSLNNERGSPGFKDCYRKQETAEVESRRGGRKTAESIPLVEETKKANVFKGDE